MYSKNELKKMDKPPPNYVPGRIRGDEGFVTRVDIGNFKKKKNIVDKKEEIIEKSSISSISIDDEEDIEADEIYNFRENLLKKRIEKKKISKNIVNNNDDKNKNKKIKELIEYNKIQFKELTENDWNSIPECTTHKKLKKNDKYIPIPDHLILDGANKNSNNFSNYIQNHKNQNLNIENFKEKESEIKAKLDNNENKLKKISSVNKEGFWTSINWLEQKNNYDINDASKIREISKNIINSQPKQPNAYLTLSRLENNLGNKKLAIEILNNGIKNIPRNGDLWYELLTLNLNSQNFDKLFLKSIENCPKLDKIWVLKYENCSNLKIKKNILIKGLGFNPKSELLWNRLIEISDDLENINNFEKACLNCPNNSKFWIFWARLEGYDKAKKILNKANNFFNFLNIDILINASILDEINSSNKARCLKIIKKGFEIVLKKLKDYKRESWLNNLLECKKLNSPLTLESIIEVLYNYESQFENFDENFKNDLDYYINNDKEISIKLYFAYINIKNEKNIYFEFFKFLLKIKDNSFEYYLNYYKDILNNYEEYWILKVEKFIQINEFSSVINLLKPICLENYNKIQLLIINSYIRLKEFEGALDFIIQLNNDNFLKIKFNLLIVLNKFDEAQTQANNLNNTELRLYYISFNYFYQSNYKLAEENIKNLKKSTFNYWILSYNILYKLQNKNSLRCAILLSKNIFKNDIRFWIYYIKFEISLNTNAGVILNLLTEANNYISNNYSVLLLLGINYKETKLSKIKSMEIYKKNKEEDLYCLISIFILFLKEKNYLEAKNWFLKALQIHKNNVDLYLYYYKYNHEAKDILNLYLENNPNQGTFWDLMLDNPLYMKLNQVELFKEGLKFII